MRDMESSHKHAAVQTLPNIRTPAKTHLFIEWSFNLADSIKKLVSVEESGLWINKLKNVTINNTTHKKEKMYQICRHKNFSQTPRKKQTHLTALKSRLTWVSQHQKRTIRIQVAAPLSLFLSLQFPLIIFLHLLQYDTIQYNELMLIFTSSYSTLSQRCYDFI